jgi:hypothetical protein
MLSSDPSLGKRKQYYGFTVSRPAYEFSTQEHVIFQLAQTFGVTFTTSVSFSATCTVVRKTQPPTIPKHLSGHHYTRKYR